MNQFKSTSICPYDPTMSLKSQIRGLEYRNTELEKEIIRLKKYTFISAKYYFPANPGFYLAIIKSKKGKLKVKKLYYSKDNVCWDTNKKVIFFLSKVEE